jgi:hypothetical protein
MRLIKLLALCLVIALTGCGGSDQADQPPPGVETDTSDLTIEFDTGQGASETEDSGQGGAPEGEP